MKKYVAGGLLLGCLAGSFLPAWAQQWQRVSVDSLTSAEFPQAPTTQQVQGQQVTMLNDDGTLYMLLVQKDAYEGNPSPAELARFYEGVEEGILQQAGGGKTIKKSDFTLNGFAGVEAQFTTPSKPQLPAVKYMCTVLINNTAYTLNYWTSVEKDAAGAGNRQHFFSSLQTNARPTPSTRRGSHAYGIGYRVGQLLAIGLLVGGVVGLVRWLRKPRQQA